MQKIERKKETQLSSKLLIAAAVVFLLLCTGAILLLNRYLRGEDAKIDSLEEVRLDRKLSGFNAFTRIATPNINI